GHQNVVPLFGSTRVMEVRSGLPARLRKPLGIAPPVALSVATNAIDCATSVFAAVMLPFEANVAPAMASVGGVLSMLTVSVPAEPRFGFVADGDRVLPSPSFIVIVTTFDPSVVDSGKPVTVVTGAEAAAEVRSVPTRA